MVRWFLGFAVLAVSPAFAAQWPDGPCRDLQRDVQRFEEVGKKAGASITEMVPLWLIEQRYCGVDVKQKLAAARRAADQEDAAAARPAPLPAKPKAADCTTLRIDRDLATTHCE